MTASKSYFAGTHRTVAPADTVERLKPLMSDFGITRIADVTGLDRIGIPVVMVVRPNSRSVAVSQGKGLDIASAKASGLMEAIETWHAERLVLPLKLASYRELSADHPVVQIDRLPPLEDSLFHRDQPILWIEGKNLFDRQPVWLPYEMVHTNYNIPRPTGHGCFPASTNGLASGNHILEATCHAICEVIERDASTLWHHLDPDERWATRIDVDTIDDPYCGELLRILAQAELEPVIWNMTTDTGVPAFYCLLLDENTGDGHMGAGAGCHPAREIALSRALTEAVQTRTTYIAGSRDDLTPAEFSEAGRAEKYRYAERMMEGGDGQGNFQEIFSKLATTMEDDIEFVLAGLAAAGIDEVAVIDMTSAKYEIPVVRVVIPGLEAPHDDDGYIPGPRALSVVEASQP
ncbi:YcaO-like family protein [Anderseniella sp. Alg231-50]|uniref:YcaO-like family protein n=1 Tax=Anderseniella sp. Alg231-50 TaxID=1922226 RepID=UPI000D5526D6